MRMYMDDLINAFLDGHITANELLEESGDSDYVREWLEDRGYIDSDEEEIKETILSLIYNDEYKFPWISDKSYWSAIKNIGKTIKAVKKRGRTPDYWTYLSNIAYKNDLNEAVLHTAYQLWSHGREDVPYRIDIDEEGNSHRYNYEDNQEAWDDIIELGDGDKEQGWREAKKEEERIRAEWAEKRAAEAERINLLNKFDDTAQCASRNTNIQINGNLVSKLNEISLNLRVPSSIFIEQCINIFFQQGKTLKDQMALLTTEDYDKKSFKSISFFWGTEARNQCAEENKELELSASACCSIILKYMLEHLQDVTFPTTVVRVLREKTRYADDVKKFGSAYTCNHRYAVYRRWEWGMTGVTLSPQSINNIATVLSTTSEAIADKEGRALELKEA